jgi:3-hydroxyisobutyrate dehydrogenase
VEAVLFGAGGLADGLGEGALVIDCSTIAPAASRTFAERLAQQGVGFVDAPVSGGSEGALRGTLTIMVGGAPEDVARARPVLEAMGSSITHMGPVGAGQTTKAVNQVILSGVYLGVAEGMVLALKSGLDAQQVTAALAGGAAGSWVLQNRAQRMIDDDYPLGFRIALHLKDLTIALEQAREVGAALPIAAMAAQIEAGLVARGYGDDDNSALARAVREWSGL